MQSNQRRSQAAAPYVPSTLVDERLRTTRKIDCAPRGGTAGPQSPITGRGRGEPDPERWASDLRTSFRT